MYLRSCPQRERSRHGIRDSYVFVVSWGWVGRTLGAYAPNLVFQGVTENSDEHAESGWYI